MNILVAVLLTLSPQPLPLHVTPAAVDTPPPMWKHERPGYYEQAPTYTPYTVEPRLINRDDVRAELIRAYPRKALQRGDSAIVLLWVYVDTAGYIRHTFVKQTGGKEFDRAAERVAGIMRFTPALNGTRPVGVWIQLPFKFSGDPKR